MSEGHSETVLKMHKAMVELGEGMPASDVMAALALTVAYASRYCIAEGATIYQGLKAFNSLVILEFVDPTSQMVKPRKQS